MKESDIKYEGRCFYVVQYRGEYEIRKNVGTHSVAIGACTLLEQAIRCAKRLELYPARVK